MDDHWVVLALDMVAASMLISAGLVKQVSPERLAAALNELRGGLGQAVGDATVRTVAAVEIVVGCGLLVPAARLTAAAGAALAGLCFASLGIAGRLRSSTLPCGCTGGYGRRPLGLVNVAVGLALVAVLPANLLVGLAPERAAEFAERGVVGTAILLSVLAVWANRELAFRLIRSPAGQNGTW